jgi:hypothetical protein
VRARVQHLVVAGVLVLAMHSAGAQPVPPSSPTPASSCDECARGDAVLDRFSLHAVRSFAAELATLSLGDPLTDGEYAQVIELRQRSPDFVRLGAVDDGDLALIASSLCQGKGAACKTTTAHALRCLADRCAVSLPEPDPRKADMPVLPEECNRYDSHKAPSRLGLGFDWGTGVQTSRYPNDGSVWSFGIESRLRVTDRIGAVARVDRTAGRDEAEDVDGNGKDDRSTGGITRVSGLAGPSFILADQDFEDDTRRFLRLDLLGGYLATRSQPDEQGPAVGFDLAYQLSVVRVGVRVVHTFADGRDPTMLLAHLGIVVGGGPEYRDDYDCNASRVHKRSRLALAIDVPMGGTAISKIGYLATGLGFETIWHIRRRFDAIARADVLVFPGDKRDRVLHHAALAGVRIDLRSKEKWHSHTGWSTTVMGGYTHEAGLTPTATGSGPVADVSLGWGGQDRDGAASLRLHARVGLTPDNVDYFVLFLSSNFELRFDRDTWSDRF